MEAQMEDPMEFEEEDQTPGVAENEDSNADALLGTGSSPTANIIATAGMSLLPDKNLSFLSDELNKRQRCNAKAVEWLSMEGEHLGQFRSVRYISPPTAIFLLLSTLICVLLAGL